MFGDDQGTMLSLRIILEPEIYLEILRKVFCADFSNHVAGNQVVGVLCTIDILNSVMGIFGYI